MFAAVAAALLVAMIMVMCRALLGPTAFDRVLALNNLGTKTVVLIAVLGFLSGRPDFLDLALAYALINFIGTVAVLKYFEFGDLGAGVRGPRVGTAVAEPPTAATGQAAE